MEKVRVEDAVGMVLCHDITEIVPGEFKGRAFAKGHIIEEKDIEKLLDLGKRHIYVWDLSKGYVHENDAALRMVQAAAGENITFSEVKEGKIELRAACDGVLKIDLEALYELNDVEEICFATIHGNKMVTKGKLLGGARVIPLAVREEILTAFEKISAEHRPVISVRPFRPAKIGVVTTGSEIQSGRIQDKFWPVLEDKAAELGAELVGQKFPGDDPEEITKAIRGYLDQGVDMVQVTGGMSVDPDDMTPSVIRALGGEVITYGTPVLPGAMFMLSYVDGVPVVGLPGCVMYSKRTVFDLIVPRLLTGEKLSKRDFVLLAHGGQCQNCPVCTYPDCGFGQ
ncbi:MAG TPA: molybdopterin-binding protein [Candidatus Fusicatenibacter merdavium]|uniref:Molybdopterin molybdenumtransferase n=1 Tax=Candidatus Fusicatenibacter merdavium TaxID=2838600 RepID=A0A9D1XCE1_9FIRM|nr:molybdopterin-binding protein [Candidatus Fusicatenibacter merdavium]